MNSAVISVGSNIDPEANVKKALEILSAEESVIAVSSFEWTKARGNADQPDFLNGAVRIETRLERDELKPYLREIERRLGRVRSGDINAARTIDLDITVYNGTIVDRDFFRYDFVRKAVLELLPELAAAREGEAG